MKYLLILTMLWFCSCKVGNKVSVTPNRVMTDTVLLDSLFMDGIRCGVVHGTKEGLFSCDFKGTYYPYNIFDSTIRKWFIKVDKNCDSLFYFRTDVERVYIWNGRGYERGNEDWSETIFYPYKGYDTLREMKQVWRPKNKL